MLSGGQRRLAGVGASCACWPSTCGRSLSAGAGTLPRGAARLAPHLTWDGSLARLRSSHRCTHRSRSCATSSSWSMSASRVARMACSPVSVRAPGSRPGLHLAVLSTSSLLLGWFDRSLAAYTLSCSTRPTHPSSCSSPMLGSASRSGPRPPALTVMAHTLTRSSSFVYKRVAGP